MENGRPEPSYSAGPPFGLVRGMEFSPRLYNSFFFLDGGYMRRRIEKSATAPKKTPLAISIPEILLFCLYFLAVWMIPVNWLDSGFGAIAFEIARKINPYLSEYSIAFARDPKYFIHCHVLASWIITPAFFPLIIRNNGGARVYSEMFKERLESFGGLSYYLVFACIGFGILYFGMLLMVDFPLSRSERAYWVSGISYTALMMSGMLSAWIGFIFMALYTQLLINNKKLK
jgi:hypothetical protein